MRFQLKLTRQLLLVRRHPLGLTAEEKQAFDQLSFIYKNVYYAYYMGSRPQALVALTDSPVGLATFMIDPTLIWSSSSRTFAGQAEGLTRDDVLDNVTLYWLTNTAVSAARIYWENKLAFFSPKGVTVPVAVSAFPTSSIKYRGVGQRKRIPN